MLLETAGLDKKFNGVYALKDLTLSIREGEIHGLVGENGAGKSTFIKILGGVYIADGGSIRWEGSPLTGSLTPEVSRAAGINIIYQDHVLIPAFSGLENICLGRPYPVKNGLIQWKEMERAANEKAEEIGIRMDLKKPVSEMGPSQKKCVEIIRAMMSDCKLLILDEPTASLSDKETGMLFQIIRRLKEKGTSVLYVSHRLEEILALTDRVTVLRNGELVTTVPTPETSKKELVQYMSGGEAAGAAETPDREQELTPTTGPALEAREIYSKDGIVKGASLTAKPSRITGLFGLCGSGRTEFLECIYGYRKVQSGQVLIGGKQIEKPSPPQSIENGLAFVCEDRRGKGLIMDYSVLDNMILSSIDRYSRHGRLLGKKAAGKAAEMMEALKIKCIGTGQRIAELSGGNQQKVVFARAMLTEPSVWLCDEPTQAVDVATRQQIHRLLREEARKGKAILYVSSDLMELLEVADEVAVMAAGRIVRTFENKNLQSGEVLACCYEAEREEVTA